MDPLRRLPPPVNSSAAPRFSAAHRTLPPSPPREPYHRHHHRLSYEDEGRVIPYIPPAAYPSSQHTRDFRLLYVSPPPHRVALPEPPSFPPRCIPREFLDDVAPVRVRDFPVRRETELFPPARLEVVASRKRQRSHECVYIREEEADEAPELLGGWSPSSHRIQPAIWGGAAAVRHADSPFRFPPPEVSSSQLLRSTEFIPPVRDRYLEEEVMHHRERVYSPQAFQVDDMNKYRERSFVARGSSSSRDAAVTPRKRSVWQRLEEGNPVTYSPLKNNDYPVPDGVGMLPDLDLSFRSSVFVDKEVSVSPSRSFLSMDRGDFLVDRISGKEPNDRISRKEPIKGLPDSLKPIMKESDDVIPANKCTNMSVASDGDKPLYSEKKVKIGDVNFCPPIISTSKADVVDGVTNFSGPPKRKLNMEEFATKSDENAKLLELAGEGIYDAVPSSGPKHACSVGQAATDVAVFRKACGGSPSAAPSTLLPQTSRDEPKKKATEKVVVHQSPVSSKLVKSVSTEGGTPKKRVVIRKRLVPRGTKIKKHDGKSAVEGPSDPGVAKAMAISISDRELSNGKVIEEKRKSESLISNHSSISKVCTKASNLETSLESLTSKKVTTENTWHIPIHHYSSAAQEGEMSLNLKVVSPRESNGKQDEVLATERKDILNDVVVSSNVPEKYPGGSITITSKLNIPNKKQSRDITVLSSGTEEPGTVTVNNILLSSNNSVLEGTSISKLAEGHQEGASIDKHADEIAAGTLSSKAAEKNVPPGIAMHTTMNTEDTMEVVVPQNSDLGINDKEGENLKIELRRKSKEETTCGTVNLPVPNLANQSSITSSVLKNHPDSEGLKIVPTPRKRNRHVRTSKEETTSRIVNLPVPNLTNQITPSVKKNHPDSEGLEIIPKKRKRRRKTKRETGSDAIIVMAPPSARETADDLKRNTSGAFANQAVCLDELGVFPNHIANLSKQIGVLKSADPCSHQLQLEEACYLPTATDPCKDLKFSVTQDPFTLSSTCHKLNQPMSSDGKQAGVLGRIPSIGTAACFPLHNAVLQKPSQGKNIASHFSGQEKSSVHMGPDDGGAHLENDGALGSLFGETSSSQTVLVSQLSKDGSRPATGQIVFPNSSGHSSMEEIVFSEEQEPPTVSSCLERVNLAANGTASSNCVRPRKIDILPSNLVSKTTNVPETTGNLIEHRDIEGKGYAMEAIGVEEKKVIAGNQQNGDKDGAVENKTTDPDDILEQELLALLHMGVQCSSPNHRSYKIATQVGEDCEMIVATGVLGTGGCLSSEKFPTQPEKSKSFDQNPSTLESATMNPKFEVQIEQQSTLDSDHHLGNLNANSIEKSSWCFDKSSNLEPKVGLSLEKNMLSVPGLPDDNTPSSSSNAKTKIVGFSQIVATEESVLPKKAQDSVKNRLSSQQVSLPVRHSRRIASGLSGRNRTWHRMDPSVVQHPPAQLKLSGASYIQKQVPKRPEGIQESYVRKGNSLIRKSNEATSLPHLLPVLGCSIGTSSEIGNIRTSEVAAISSSAIDHVKSGKHSSIGRPKTLPLPLSPKESYSKTIYQDHTSTKNSFDAGQEDQIIMPNAPDIVPSICKSTCISIGDQFTVNDSKRMVYVKHKSNQLVASKGYDTSNLLSLPSTSQITPTLPSDLYYTRKKNKLIRDTSTDNLAKQDTIGSFSTSGGNRTTNSHKSNVSKKVARKGKNIKKSKFSLVWHLNSVRAHGEYIASSARYGFLPYILPWKRATYRRTSLVNTSKNNSLKLISRKLHICQRRNASYTTSNGGFALLKPGIRSIAGRSWKWSKSIEKHAKKDNEEPTLTVAKVERAQRKERNKKCTSKERIFRVGNVRYRMDSSKKTLIRIPDGESSGTNSLKCKIPSRLIIDNDEYVRVGTGNKLIRDPRRLVRMLASEKVRWSLHTARQRLARKHQYCQFFTRFGKCNKEGKKCSYIHDPTKVAICTKFLKGVCSGTDCNLTHKVIPERMPDCSYFLHGHCSNSACPYRHVNVNPGASVCEGFLKGYCRDGDECQKKHSYNCPDFEATGKCFHGSDCKLHHPKSKKKSKRQKKSDLKEHSKGRYFESSLLFMGLPPILAGSRIIEDTEEGEICLEDTMADYISLDVGLDEDSANNNKQMDLLPVDLDSDLSDAPSYDLDEFIKPLRIMKRKGDGVVEIAT